MKKPKKPTKAYAAWRARVDRKNALKSWSKNVRARDGGKCLVCGAVDNLHAHHLLPKEYYKQLALELDNGLSVCAKHHKFGALSFHRNPIWAVTWLELNKPDQLQWCINHIQDIKETKLNE